MSWLGAGLGAFIGARNGSILGGVMGAVIGNWLEGKARELLSGGDKPAAPGVNGGNNREMTVLAAIAAMLSKMAKADGRITLDEVHYCETVFDRLGLRGEKREFCIRVFRAAKNDAYSIYDYADSLIVENVDASIRKIIYDILWDLACIDSEATAPELEVLRRIPEHLQLSAAVFNEQYVRRGLNRRGSVNDGEADPYGWLGVSPTASDEDVKRAYREKAKALHPDRLRAEGLSEELMRRANDEMASVNAAWREIRRRRGI